MRLPIIKHLVNFAESNDEDFIEETISVLEHLISARGIKEEELDVIGELISNMEGTLIVLKDIKSGTPQKEALNAFMKRVTNIGQ